MRISDWSSDVCSSDLTMMTLSHTRQLRTWFIFDELAALHKLPALERGLQTARSFGGALGMGLHTFGGLRIPYGEDGARNINTLANTRVMLRKTARTVTVEADRVTGLRSLGSDDQF